jgi:hypothetical protein
MNSLFVDHLMVDLRLSLGVLLLLDLFHQGGRKVLAYNGISGAIALVVVVDCKGRNQLERITNF